MRPLHSSSDAVKYSAIGEDPNVERNGVAFPTVAVCSPVTNMFRPPVQLPDLTPSRIEVIAPISHSCKHVSPKIKIYIKAPS